MTKLATVVGGLILTLFSGVLSAKPAMECEPRKLELEPVLGHEMTETITCTATRDLGRTHPWVSSEGQSYITHIEPNSPIEVLKGDEIIYEISFFVPEDDIHATVDLTFHVREYRPGRKGRTYSGPVPAKLNLVEKNWIPLEGDRFSFFYPPVLDFDFPLVITEGSHVNQTKVNISDAVDSVSPYFFVLSMHSTEAETIIEINPKLDFLARHHGTEVLANGNELLTVDPANHVSDERFGPYPSTFILDRSREIAFTVNLSQDPNPDLYDEFGDHELHRILVEISRTLVAE